jgi:hypothetical protein
MFEGLQSCLESTIAQGFILLEHAQTYFTSAHVSMWQTSLWVLLLS